METKLSLTTNERDEFKNIRMFKSVYNSLVKHMESLDKEIKNKNNGLVDRINKKYDITMQHDYVCDEIEGDLKHCLSNHQHIENNLIVNKESADLLDQAVGGYFEPMLQGLAREYTLIEKSRGR